MTNIDQFESVFKAADKPPFAHEVVKLQSVAVITDADAQASDEFAQHTRQLFDALSGPELNWHIIKGDEFKQISQLAKQMGPEETRG